MNLVDMVFICIFFVLSLLISISIMLYTGNENVIYLIFCAIAVLIILVVMFFMWVFNKKGSGNVL